MKYSQWLFIALFLLVIALSWLIHPAGRPSGFVEAVPWPDFKIAEFLSTRFQENCGKFISHNLPTIRYQLYLKNDVYSLLNFGLFHAGYGGAIVEGKQGILFEKGYISPLHTLPANWDKIGSEIHATLVQLEKLKASLSKYNVQLILVLAPAKTDFFFDKLPRSFTIRPLYPENGAESLGEAYSEALKKADIPFVDCFRALKQESERGVLFPDQGAHWSMYGAALCLRELSRTLHKIEPGKFPVVKISDMEASPNAEYGERELANLLNIWPRYRKGRETYHLAVYDAAGYDLSFMCYGDSFIGQLLANMVRAGYTSYELSKDYENMIPDRQEFINSLHKTDALVLVGATPKFAGDYWRKRLKALNDYFEGE